MKFKPLQDRLVVKRAPVETITPGGIIIAETVAEKPQEGEVLAIGPGRQEDGKLVAMTVKVGDRILFGKWSGTEVKIEGDDVLIMNEADVMGILR